MHEQPNSTCSKHVASACDPSLHAVYLTYAALLLSTMSCILGCCRLSATAVTQAAKAVSVGSRAFQRSFCSFSEALYSTISLYL
jgi:hypothetical protein